MKINFRLLLITFGIIVVISVTSTLIFFSLTTTILESKISNTLIKSSYDFVFDFQKLMTKLENQMVSLGYESSLQPETDIDTTDLDFIFPLAKDLNIDRNLMKVSSHTYLNFSSFKLDTFVKNNPNIMLQYIQNEKGIVFFGKVIDENFLTKFANESKLEIVLLVNGSPSEYSNMSATTKYINSIIEATKYLKNASNFTTYAEELQTAEFYASIYTYDNVYFEANKLNFLFFSTNDEVFAFRETMGMIMLILLFAGIALSLIFVMLFTTRLRKQISYLSKAAESASKGDFNNNVSIVSSDEIGRLSEVFNQMLAELRQKEKREKEYSNFLTLLNQNPTLEEIAEVTLRVVVDELGLQVGSFYLIEEKEEELISVYKLEKNNFSTISGSEIHTRAINEQIPVENIFQEPVKVVTFVSEEVMLKYCLVIPIVYHKKTIAVMEIAGENLPVVPAIDYINIIHDQLAVGIINANTYRQLKKYVGELKKLNVQYQNQNERITEKNEQLIKLHTELRLKAEELETEKSKAVELAKIKSQFLASVSHELRTPLNSIIGLTELVINDSNTVIDTKKRLKVVLKSGQKLLGLINNILDYLKIEAGKTDLKKESFVFSVFLRDIELFFEPLIKEKNLEFSIDYKIENDLLLITDRQKFEQILINLIGNAIKFTTKGSVKLTIQLLAGKELRLSVKDTGIGIKKKNMDLIFEEFRQGDGGTKRKYEGTGLGLSITKEYTKLLGGEIFVESEYRKGTEFILLFRTMVFEKIDTYEKLYFPKIEPDKEINSDYILLFTDSTATRKLVYDYLTINKFNVVDNDNVDSFMSNLSEKTPLAIILDSCSTEFNWELVSKLKSKKSTNKIPLIIIGLDENNKAGYGLDIFDYYSMPLNKDVLDRISLLFVESYEETLKKLIIITDNENNYSLQNVSYKYDVIGVDNVLKNDFQEYDLIVVEVKKSSESTFDVINSIFKNNSSKNIPVVCGLPAFDGESNELWKRKFSDIISETKHHPLDVLKVIRDRLRIYFDDSGMVQAEKKASDVIDKQDKLIHKDVTILVVDDDQDTLFTVGELLTELGYKYVSATNGVECILKLNSIVPTLILLDIMMPQMDGFETIKRIKAEKELSEIPVIALTAYAMLENKEIIEKFGFSDIITKPVSLENIAEIIHKHIKK